MEKRLRILPLLCALVLALSATPLSAHEDDVRIAPPARVLGTISFPTSAKSADAQQAFIRGMLLLHLFEYPFAREEFLTAQRIEPDFALAYWGEAMTHTHPVWDQQDAGAGRAALHKLAPTLELRQARAPSPREKAFLEAIDVLYGQGSKAERDGAYARAMERMAARFADDHEVQLFHALALLGVNAGVRDVPAYMQVGAVAQAVFCANPQHPGAAHYLIHAVDDPDHAALGLDAARALARMAPDAGHSLHMTSHIFTALGMWDDMVQANEAAVAVASRMKAERGEKAGRWGHYNFWLLYGYLQQGRIEQARALMTAALEQLKSASAPPGNRLELDSDNSPLGSVVQMWVRFLVETGEWDGAIAQWTFDAGDAFDPALNLLFAKTLRAAQRGEVAPARRYLEEFRRLHTELDQALRAQAESKPTDQLYLQRLEVLERELQAQIDLARGDRAAAIAHAREASRLEGQMPYSFGPPFIDWPAAEMLGQLQLHAGEHGEAAKAFATQSERARRRPASLLGLARSQHALGHAAEADHALEQLRAVWHRADPAVQAALRAPATP